MIEANSIFALVSFYFVMYVTPGPNNAMVLTSGLKFGFLRTIPHIFGITIGHIIQVILVCFGLTLYTLGLYGMALHDTVSYDIIQYRGTVFLV